MKEITKSLVALGVPQHILAALEALQLKAASAERIALLSGAERQRFLDWCDARQLTLMLPEVSPSPLPSWVLASIREKKARYELRFTRLKEELFEVVDALDKAGLEFLMLKGLSHSPTFTPDARFRAQGDIDLWLTRSSVHKAQRILENLGYVPLLDSKKRHLPPMGRPSAWRWRGDLFDPEMPVSVELHYELWSEEAEHIPIPGLERFWDRKQPRDFDGHKINVLCEEDLVSFAALHLMLHLLHGDLPLQRAWEIANFLQTRATDDTFWASWRKLHPMGLKQMETAVFYIVTKWFGCRSRQEFVADLQKLPVPVKLWLEKYCLAPLARRWAPNKAEIWLHLAHLSKRKHKLFVLLRRLLPMSMPSFANRAGLKPSSLGRLLKPIWHIRLLTTRLTLHVLTFLPTLADGLRWYWLSKSRAGRESDLEQLLEHAVCLDPVD